MNWLTLSLGCFSAVVLLHSLGSWRLFFNNAIVGYFVIAAVTGVGLIAWMAIAELPTDDALAALLTYGFIAELYMFMFTLSLGSVSAKILQLLRRSTLSQEEIEASYAPKQMVNVRLERLVFAGLIYRQANGFRLTNKGRRLRFSVDRVRRFLHNNGQAPR